MISLGMGFGLTKLLFRYGGGGIPASMIYGNTILQYGDVSIRYEGC